MRSNLLRIICTPSEAVDFPVENTAVFSHILQNGQLLRCRNAENLHCAAAILSGSGENCGEPMRAELRRLHCTELLADTESPSLAAELDALCAGENIRLFVPPEVFPNTEHAAAIECASITAGSYEKRLTELAQRYGERFAVDLTPLRVEFILPSDGRGRVLSREELTAQLADSPLTYYSSDLRARYLTRQQNDSAQFVVYDDAETLREKIALAESFGAKAVFLPCAEARDLIKELI